LHFGLWAEAKKEYDGEDDDMDGFQSDEEDEDESDKEMGEDDEEGDEADSLKFQKLAAQVFMLESNILILIMISNKLYYTVLYYL